MRRRTRGGRNIPTLTRRVTRRKQSANLALKAKEKANEVIEESEKLQRQLHELASTSQQKMVALAYGLIKISEEEQSKKTLTLEDYISGFTIRLRRILENPYQHLSQNQNYINLKKDLIRQYSTLANQLSNDSHEALHLSTKTPLSNRPNQIDNNEANEEMQRILTRTSEKISSHPSSVPLNELFARMNLAIQIAHIMEYITYLYVINTTEKRKPLSLRTLSILEKKKIVLKSDVRPMQSTSNNIESNRIRDILGIDLARNGRELKKGGIHYIFHWLVDATNTAWDTSIEAIKKYKELSPHHFSINSTLLEVSCYRSQYNLYMRLPILLLFNLKGKVLSDIGTIRSFKDTLLQWKDAEEKYNPEPSSFFSFYLKKRTRLQFVKWLKDNQMDQNSKMPQYMSLFTNYDQEVRETEEWLQAHDPNRPIRPQGFVRSEVARIEQSAPSASSTAAPSASAPASVPVAAPVAAPVKPSPMKVAPKPATGFSLDAYKKREATNKAYQQSLKK